MEKVVSVVGLGKLGLGLALSFASGGLKTLGVDVNVDVVDAINSGYSPIVETGYDELIKQLGDRFTATLSHSEAIEKTDITFILVQTPSISDGRFSNRYVEGALRSLAEAFATSSKPYHLFVISSTVIPGSTDRFFIPLLEKYSGKKLNVDFGVCFDPDFVALGSVVRDFLNPELIVIGESSPSAGEQVAAIHEKICQNRPVISRMSIISAELAKVSLNAYITMKISFANTLANLCEKIPDTDIDAITRAIGVDRRISPYYFKGGMAFGGTCFPRDTKAFIAVSQQYGNDAHLIRATEQVNTIQNHHLAEMVLMNISENKRVSILGLAFKHGTPVIEESPAIKLIDELISQDVEVLVYDALAMQNVKVIYNDKISYAHSIQECLTNVDVCVFTLEAPEYKIAIESLAPLQPLTIIDCWRMIDPAKLADKVKYLAVGRNWSNS